MIVVNGAPRDDLPAELTVAGLLDVLDLPHAGRGVAVAVEASVVPRSQWDSTALAEGARVEVLVAVQGG